MPLFGTGEKSETGASNNIVNLPFSQGALGLDVLEGWKDYLLPSALEFKPKSLIILSRF